MNLEELLAKHRAIGLFFVVALGVFIGTTVYTFMYFHGYSYILDDPVICTNCHIMRENFDSWNVSSHKKVSCGDCHLPHNNYVLKYLAKAKNGIKDVYAFTIKDIQVLHITKMNLKVLEKNCVRCHEPMTSFINQTSKEKLVCTKCHKGAGHVF